jgi:hypothetical protein
VRLIPILVVYTLKPGIWPASVCVAKRATANLPDVLLLQASQPALGQVQFASPHIAAQIIGLETVQEMLLSCGFLADDISFEQLTLVNSRSATISEDGSDI